MARDLILDVLTKADSRGLTDTAKGLDAVADSSDDASSSFKKLGQESGHVDSQITKLRAHMRELATEFDRTGDTDLLKDIGKDQSAIRRLERVGKLLGEVGVEGGKQFNKGLLSSMGDLGGNLRGALIPVAIGAAGVLAPFLGAVIAGAVAGTVGVGGIAGGIAMAAREPRVKQAASRFGADIADEFFADGDMFVEPIIKGLDVLRNGFRNLGLSEALKPLADSVPVLAEAFAGFAVSAMPGLKRAFEAAVPAIEVLADMLPRVGDALGDMFGDIAEGEDALTGLRSTLATVEALLRATGATVEFLSERWRDFLLMVQSGAHHLEDLAPDYLAERFRAIEGGMAEMTGTAAKLNGEFALIPGRMQNTADVAGHLAERFQEQAEAANDAFKRMTELNEAYGAAVARQQDLMGASINFEEALDDLTAAFEANGKTLNINTAAGRENMKIVQDGIREARNMRQATFEQTGSWAEANRVYDAAIRKLEGVASKAGVTARKLREMAGDYRINVTQTTKFITTGTPPSLAQGGPGRVVASFADGGWVPGPVGAPQMIQAHGGEFVLSRDMLSGRASAPPAAAAASGSQRIERIELGWRPGAEGAAMYALGEVIRQFVYVHGGNPMTALSS